MQIVCVAKELKSNFQLRQRSSGFGDLVTLKYSSELMVSSIVALGRRVGEQLREFGVKGDHMFHSRGA